jgi:hypothetical protein
MPRSLPAGRIAAIISSESAEILTISRRAAAVQMRVRVEIDQEHAQRGKACSQLGVERHGAWA